MSGRLCRLLLAAVVAARALAAAPGWAGLSAGQTAPNFTLYRWGTTTPVSLYDLEGKIVLLDFFAYWCGPCKTASSELEPYIQDYYTAQSGNPAHIPVLLVSMNVEGGNPSSTQNYINTYGLETVLDDSSRNVLGTYDNAGGGIPQFAIISGAAGASLPQWQIIFTQVGYGAGLYNTFRQHINGVTLAATTPCTWSGAASSAWGTGSNWASSAIAHGQAVQAVFGNSGARTNVDLAAPQTVGKLVFNSTVSTIIASSANKRLTLDNGTSNATIQAAGTHAITAPITLTGSLDVAVTQADSTLSLGPMTSAFSAGGLTKTGPGTLRLTGANNFTGGTTVSGGTLEVAHADALPSGRRLTLTSAGTSVRLSPGLANAVVVGAMTLDGGSSSPAAVLDLTTDKLVVSKSATPLSTIRAQIKAAYAGGTWTGKGITSSNAAADAGNLAKTAVASADNAVLGKTTFGGRTLTASSLLLAYTYAGDANIDGVTNLTDFGTLKNNFGKAAGALWNEGDFNYDDRVNLTDFGLLKNSFGATRLWTASVPEPAAAALLAAAVLAAAAGLRLRCPPPSRADAGCSRRARRGFTLVELLVVVAIIGMLAALLLPAILSARASARKARCASHLHDLGAAVANYHTNFNMLPPCVDSAKLTWPAALLPFIGRGDLAKAGDPPAVRVEQLVCPADPQGQAKTAPLSYVGNRNLFTDQAGPGGQRVAVEKLVSISQTILVSERCGAGPWTPWKSQGEITFGWNTICTSPGNCTTTCDVSSEHRGGVNVLFCDGRVEFLDEATDWGTLPQGP